MTHLFANSLTTVFAFDSAFYNRVAGTPLVDRGYGV